MLVLIVMASLHAELVDVEAAFLNGRYDNGEEIFVKVLDGMRKWYPPHVLLRLLRTMYGTNKGSMQYWREVAKAMRAMQIERSQADPCLYFKLVDGSIVAILVWVDDCLNLGWKETVMKYKRKWMSIFDCKDLGEAMSDARYSEGSIPS